MLVLPITHTVPNSDTRSIEIPSQVKSQLGLDGERSWIVLSEWNEFTWPGCDLRQLHEGDDATVAYGMLPQGLFAKMRGEILRMVRSGQVKGTGRG